MKKTDLNELQKHYTQINESVNKEALLNKAKLVFREEEVRLRIMRSIMTLLRNGLNSSEIEKTMSYELHLVINKAKADYDSSKQNSDYSDRQFTPTRVMGNSDDYLRQ